MNSSKFCFTVNGGTCRNLVSQMNNFVCAAGHRRNSFTPNAMFARDFAFQGAKPLARMSLDEREERAGEKDLSEEEQVALSQDKSEWVKLSLSKNNTLCEKAELILAEDENVWVKVNLAWNPSLSPKARKKLMGDSEPAVIKAISKRKESENQGKPPVLVDLRDGSVFNPAEVLLEESVRAKDDRELTKNFLDRLIEIVENNKQIASDQRLRSIVGSTYASYVASQEITDQDKNVYRDKILKTFLLDKEPVANLQDS